MRIDSSGNVGIGTDNPSVLIEGQTSTANSAYLRLGSSLATSSHVADSDIGALEFYSGDNSGAGSGVKGSIRYKYGSSSGATTHMTFHTAGISSGNDTERMRIDSSGNLLVGKTSTGDYVTGIEMQPAGAILSYRTGGVASIFGRTDNGEITRFTRNGSIVGAIGARTSSELYIDLGSTGLTGSSTGGGALLPTSGGTSYTDASVDLGFSSGRFRDLYLSSKVRLQYPGNSYYARVEVDSSTTLIFGAGPNGSERAKITSAGNLLVGRTSAGATGNGHSIRGGDSAIFSRDSSGESMIVARNSSTGDIVRFYSGGVDKGSINFDGGSTISYTSGSDQRLKENIVDAPSASNDIDDLQVRSFDWKSNGAHQKYGMIAQEMQTVAPEAVWAPADPDEMMGVDYSKLVPMLVKEIQSLRARVAQLENN
jgi:hypothetical protein